MWEGHYTYPGSNLTFIPTYGGGMFEAMMPNIVVPETSWGTSSFGLADAQTVQVQIKYATQQLDYKVWGMSPSSTADDTGGYNAYGVEGLAFPYYGTGADASRFANRPCQGPSALSRILVDNAPCYDTLSPKGERVDRSGRFLQPLRDGSGGSCQARHRQE